MNYNGLFRPAELREFSQAFNTAAQELSSTELLRKDFINNFSHEFKTPIVSLGGFARLLREETLSPQDQAEYLDIIISESDRLAQLATNILMLSKIEAQSIVAQKNTFQISEQIRQSVLMMESKWRAKQLCMDLELEELYFTGNEELLKQVWVNVIDNAIKFSADRTNVIIILTREGDHLNFSVQDQGCGMDEHTRAHMFDQFFQGDTSHATEGNGLGMAMVHKIVELHNGRILVESTPGVGTRVTVTLPVQDI